MATRSKTSEPTIEDLSAQIETLQEDFTALGKVLSDYGKAEGAAAAQAVRDQGEKAAAQGRAYAGAVQDSAEAGAAHTLDQIRRQPAAAVGIAAGVGFLVGLVAGRR